MFMAYSSFICVKACILRENFLNIFKMWFVCDFSSLKGFFKTLDYNWVLNIFIVDGANGKFGFKQILCFRGEIKKTIFLS